MNNNDLTAHVFSQKRLEDKVVAFVVKDEIPFRVVEGAGFVEMMNEAQPRFKIPNRKKIASLVWDLYAVEVAKIKSVIGDQWLSITTDTWTSIQNINYMVITTHFLDDDWKFHKRIINFTKITSHKGDHIGNVLETCLSDWGIDKFFTITVDNASTNDKAVGYMGKRLNEWELWERAQVFVNFLKRFHDTTLQLSARKTITSTMIWEEIVSMKIVIDETMLDTIDPSLQEVAKRMKSMFRKFWGDFERVNNLVFLGHILDLVTNFK
ncbi:hypothetical protein F511_15873 [Dorcoceras hygrometricum]|uniref:Zinc finger BED domain-containing protein RICESLEEPER 2-like n=1 Tax=Dorcoceras hygrometricum TaxID=472368 RepID=A0A2Z7B927_9LAMI|nr:hypothetical protein F511_15873 [Dorcoceras hygrometricum]